jgi:aldose 1-epimerase
MGFQVQRERRPVPGREAVEVVVLREQSGAARAEVCPALGFNCFSWQLRNAKGPVDLLHAEPDFLQGKHNTRSGWPILFPFPNRIRDGRFTWNGKAYSIPPEPPHKDAIHGFVCQRAWEVIDHHDDADSAVVEAQFQGSVQAPETKHLWPADYIIRAAWKLSQTALELQLTVRNPDRVVLPFGAGTHPYFRLAESDKVQVFATKYWELAEMLPTGKVLPVNSRLDLTQPRPLRDLQLDDVLTDIRPPTADTGLPPSANAANRLRLFGQWKVPGVGARLRAAPVFREAVVFTPGNRQAFCLEPYTCTTDAINLQQRGIDAGLLTLDPGQEWKAKIVAEAGVE